MYHWCLVLVENEYSSLTLFEPIENMRLKRSREMHQLCKDMEYYTNKPWQFTSARTQAQKDGYNCGVHICAIGAALLQEKCLTDMIPSKYRRKIRNTIQRHFNGIHSSTNAPSEGGLNVIGNPNNPGWEKSIIGNEILVDQSYRPDDPNRACNAPQTPEELNTIQDTTGNNLNI